MCSSDLWDEDALASARERLGEFGDRVQLVGKNFAELEAVLMALGITTVDGVMFDLGVSSHQFDEPSRGFSVVREGLLDMRMSRQLVTSARDLVRTASESELADIFFHYGEERRARGIARAIVRARERGEPLETTGDLARLCGPRRGKIHPATRVFQALRIAVNDELGEVERGIAAALHMLAPGGRLVVVAFHSLEDRIVKQAMAAAAGRGGASRHDPAALVGRAEAGFRLLTSRALRPEEAECSANPRARSARLRGIERLPQRLAA